MGLAPDCTGYEECCKWLQWQLLHQRGPNRGTFPLPYRSEPPYDPTVLPTVGCRPYSLVGYSRNPLEAVCSCTISHRLRGSREMLPVPAVT
jgi:hypothetical protein